MPAAPGTDHRWRAFGLLAGAYFMTIIDLTIVNVTLPTIGRDLHFAASNLQWVATAYALTYGGLILLGGRFADLFTRRHVLLGGLAAFTGASLVCALSRSPGLLIGARAAQGIGAAAMVPAAQSILMNMFPETSERNKALGIWNALGATGATVGVITGGILTRYVGWQYIFYLNLPIGALGLLLAPRIVPASPVTGVQRRFDALGAGAATGGLVLLVDAVSQAPNYGWGSARTLGVLAASIGLLVTFVIVEMRVEAPLLPLRIFKSANVGGANLTGLLAGGAFFAFFYVGTLYMQQVLGYSALQTGLAWLATTVTSLALTGLSAGLVTKIGPKPVMTFGVICFATGIIWAAFVPRHGHYLADLVGPMAVTGVGTAFGFIPISIAALGGVAENEAGLASGLFNTSLQTGSALGIALASSVAVSHAKTLSLHGDPQRSALTGGFQSAFWVLGVMAALALPTLILLIRREPVATATLSATTDPAAGPTPELGEPNPDLAA